MHNFSYITELSENSLQTNLIAINIYTVNFISNWGSFLYLYL